ncbi:hypothetical protein PNK_0345 [Candidatus Protochlamydia naegleriophila]|uniref:Uncharacterized protein n=1 Tax=Candidatus Protochlamydia naegleriophila TaxID=389348 RepID=A0A0U5J968_9BACT|nr:hypothetical protein [Candidatus Protochlamydia naegleriophila]CUI15982.1 hypothetical protein PNK_0345 [Candidatus Protochlamydia naegleriophila]
MGGNIPSGGTNDPTFNLNLQYDRPGVDNDVDVSIQGSSGRVSIDIVKGDPNKADTIETFNILEGQNFRITGSFSTSASAPVLDPPLAEAIKQAVMIALTFSLPKDDKTSQAVYDAIIDYQTKVAMANLGMKDPNGKTEGTSTTSSTPPPGGGDPIKQLASNPFFNPSFLANFSAIMDELLNLKRDTSYLEAQVELKARELTIAITTTQSELTLMIAQAQAAEKMVEAITSFIQAGVAAISLAQTWGNAATARKDAEKTLAADKKIEQQNLDKVKAQRDEIEQRSPVVSTDPNGVQTRNPPLTPADEKKLAQYDKEIAGHEKSLQNMDRPEYLRQLINTRTQELNLQSDLKQQIVKNVVAGAGSAIQSGIIAERGSLEALKVMNDGYLDLLRKYGDSTARSKDQEKADFKDLVDFVNKITDSVFKAHSLSPA